MANHLSVATIIEKNRVSSPVAFVILLDLHIVDPNSRDVVETIRICQNTENILFGTDDQGQPIVYQAGNFEINLDQKMNAASTVTLTAQDQHGLISSRVEAYAGGVFSEVVLTVVNSARLDKPAEIQERFSVLSSSIKDMVMSATLGAENPLMIQFPKYKQFRERCAWRFKGYGCAYSGALQTCDYSVDGANGCEKHFTGRLPFRGLPGLVSMNV